MNKAALVVICLAILLAGCGGSLSVRYLQTKRYGRALVNEQIS
jgi:hypothetical protein